MNIVSVASIVFVLNLPFGYWRANVRKFSRPWFLSVHAPVPLVIALRVFSGLGWQLITFPIMIGAFFLGQVSGSGLHLLRNSRPGSPVSSCLVRDLLGKRKRPEVNPE
ncbi:MAG TPA: hypothetical protein VLN91_07220 [Nitrospirota bacterium]|nr:hypothetical protein [Nitrospirota bacterium]